MVGEPPDGEPYGRSLVHVTDPAHEFDAQSALVHGSVDPVSGLPHQSDDIKTPAGRQEVVQADEG